MKVVQIMEGVGNVIGKIHHRAFQSLSARRKVWKCLERLEHLWQIDDVGGELCCSLAARAPSAAGRDRPVSRMRRGIVKAGPGIFQNGSASCCGQVETLVRGAQNL